MTRVGSWDIFHNNPSRTCKGNYYYYYYHYYYYCDYDYDYDYDYLVRPLYHASWKPSVRLKS